MTGDKLKEIGFIRRKIENVIEFKPHSAISTQDKSHIPSIWSNNATAVKTKEVYFLSNIIKPLFHWGKMTNKTDLLIMQLLRFIIELAQNVFMDLVLIRCRFDMNRRLFE